MNTPRVMVGRFYDRAAYENWRMSIGADCRNLITDFRFLGRKKMLMKQLPDFEERLERGEFDDNEGELHPSDEEAPPPPAPLQQTNPASVPPLTEDIPF